VRDLHEEAGLGLCATVEDALGLAPVRSVRLGSARHVDSVLPASAADETASQVFLAEDGMDGRGRELVHFDLTEGMRPEVPAAVASLCQLGVAVQMLSGDRQAAVQRVAAQAGIDLARGECTPQDKLLALQALQKQGRRVGMVGDGINDGPVLAGANVSFAFGSAAPLAQSRADFVVLSGRLSLISQAVTLARQTTQVVRQNLWWAAAYNALAVPLAIVGWMPPWLAGLGMASSSLLVVLNAARLARWRGEAPTALPEGNKRTASSSACPLPESL
jgi:Cu2+-exporting ATPase